MNRLQDLDTRTPLFVTLNPPRMPRDELIHASMIYAHPLFDTAAIAAQQRLWRLQGARRTWFCGAYFGSGFHEDGLQAGLAVAEDARRRAAGRGASPNESGRIRRRLPTPLRPARSCRMTTARAPLYVGSVIHQRAAPAARIACAIACSRCCSISTRWTACRATAPVRPHNRFNPFSFHDARSRRRQPHAAARSGRTPAATRGIDIAGGPIRLLCMPRMLGYVFNPLSV